MSMLRTLRNGFLAYCLTSLAGLPLAANLAYADAIAESSSSGLSFGELIKNGVSVDFDQATGQVTSQGQDVITFPQDSSAMSNVRSTYGNSAALQAAVSAQKSTLDGQDSDAGNAYRTLMGGVHVPRPELRNDPIINNSEAILRDTAAAGGFGQCYTSVITTENPGPEVSFEDIKTCERFVRPPGCQVRRNITKATPVEFISGEGTGRQISASQYEMTIGREGDNYLYGNPCQIHNFTIQVKVINPAQIRLATLTYMTWDDYMKMSINGTEIFVVPEPPFPDGSTSCERSTSWSSYPNIDLSNHLKNVPPNSIVTFELSVATSDYGEGYAKIILDLEEPEQEIIQNPPGCMDNIINNPGLLGDPDSSWTPGGSINNQASNAYWQCTFASNAHTVNLSGGASYTITPNDYWFLGPLFPGEPGPPAPICFEAQQRSLDVYDSCSDQSDDPTEQQNECQQVTWANTPTEFNNCGALQANSNCQYLGSSCTDYANGTCIAYEDRYDCGTRTRLTTMSTSETLICPGDISCMGSECSAPTVAERNQQLNTVAPYVEMIKNSPKDAQCDQSGGGCRFFGGQAFTCKKILGGLQDCCDQPTNGASAVDYIKLGYYSYDLAKDMGLMESLAPMGSGLWSDISKPIGSLTDSISKPFISAYESVVGSSVGGAGAIASGAEGAAAMEGASSASGIGLGSIKQMVTNQVVDWAKSIFGEAIASTAPGASSLFVQQAGNWTLNVAGNMAAAFLSVVMWIYAIYQIITILVNLIWPCSQAEFQLAVKKEQRLCHYTGKKDKKTLGITVSTTKYYCCFSTAFARIVHQQTRNGSQPGVNKPWGGNRPDCSGFTHQQFESIDFTRVNLDEWLALLKIANLPTGANAAAQLSSDLAGSRVLSDGTRTAPTVERTKALINQQTGGSQSALDDRRETLQNAARIEALSNP